MTSQFRTLMAFAFGIVAGIMLLYIYSMPMPWQTDGFVDTVRCGPNLGTCPDDLRCINGYCKTDVAKTLPPLSDLPIHPDRYPYRQA